MAKRKPKTPPVEYEVIPFSSDPTHVPTEHTRKQVRTWVAAGMTENDIAYVMGLSPAEVQEWYSEELENGLRLTSAQVGISLLKNAVERGDTMAQQFWLKNRAGWNPPTKVEMKGNVSLEVTERQKIVDRIVAMTSGVIDPTKNDVHKAKTA